MYPKDVVDQSFCIQYMYYTFCSYKFRGTNVVIDYKLHTIVIHSSKQQYIL